MTVATTNMSLLKAQDADNAESYLVTSLGGSLDTLDAHDHSTNSKGVAVKRVQSGVDASKPSPGTAGVIYVATDTKRLYFDDGSALDFTLADPTTTRGDVIVRGATAATRLAIGTANQVLQSNGTDPAWGSVSLVLNRKTSPTAVNSTTTETTLYTFTVPGNTLGTTGVLRFSGVLDYLNNTGGGVTVTFNIKYGGVVIGQGSLPGLGSSASRKAVLFRSQLHALGATNSQVAASSFTFADPGSSASPAAAASIDPGSSSTVDNAAAVDSTASQVFALTVVLSSASTNLEAKLYAAVLELL